MMKVFLAKCAFFLWIVAFWIFIGYLLNTLCFGGVRRNPPRYKIAPTNVVVRIDGTNCYVRYMKDLLLNTNLVVSCELFDPPPLASEPSTTEEEE